MAEFARVSREKLYAQQDKVALPQDNGNGTHPYAAMDQPTWQQKAKFNVNKNPHQKNRKCKALDLNAPNMSDATGGDGGAPVPVHNPTSCDPPVPLTPETTPSPTGGKSAPQQNPQGQPQSDNKTAAPVNNVKYKHAPHRRDVTPTDTPSTAPAGESQQQPVSQKEPQNKSKSDGKPQSDNMAATTEPKYKYKYAPHRSNEFQQAAPSTPPASKATRPVSPTDIKPQQESAAPQNAPAQSKQSSDSMGKTTGNPKSNVAQQRRNQWQRNGQRNGQRNNAASNARANNPVQKNARINGRTNAPISPPTSADEKKNETPVVWDSWAQPQPVNLAGYPKDQSWPYVPPKSKPKARIENGRKNQGWSNDPLPPQPKRTGKHIWPKNRDMKPRDDETESEDDGCVWERVSDAEGNFTFEKVPRAPLGMDYDVKQLVGWDGNWLEPPIWSERPDFTDPDLAATVLKWMNTYDIRDWPNLDDDQLQSSDFQGVKAGDETIVVGGKVVAQRTINKEFAPRCWIPARIETLIPATFWESYPARAPAPVDECDLADYPPFWDCYATNKGHYLEPPQHPPVTGVEPDEEGNHHPNTNLIAEDGFARIRREWKREKEERLARKNKPTPTQCAAEAITGDLTPRYVPKSNVYLRPVVAADAPSILELYNHFVENTISTPEFNPRTLQNIVQRIETVVSGNLPYLVAVPRGIQSMGKGPQDHVQERIVGIAYLEDHCDRGSSYRYTYDLECFVHPDYQRQNIATCLLDRLLSLVSITYPARGGYSWINKGNYLKTECSRMVKVVLISIPHPNDANMEWFTKFMRKMKFRKCGHLFKMGYKGGKVIDITMYQHETFENIDPNIWPQFPL